MTQNELIEQHNNIKYRYNIKTKYCKDNNIKLLRIKHTDMKNIDKIINTCIDSF